MAEESSFIFSRREFLGYSAAAAALAMLPPALAACAGGGETYEQAEAATWRTAQFDEGEMQAHVREFIRCATLAPNGHNAQAWQFSYQGDTVTLRPDFNRRLAVVDPDDRELYISLGAALENLAVAAGAAGYTAGVTYFPDTEPDGVTVRLTAAAATGTELAAAISQRQTTRSAYDGWPLAGEDLARLQALPLEHGAGLHWFASGDELESLATWVMQGDRAQYADGAFVDELVTWLRFNDAEALRSHDGLYARCSGNPTAPRWVGRMFLALTGAEGMAKQDAEKLRSSSGAVLFVSAADDRRAWVDTGRVYERFALTAAHLGIQTAFLNQPVEVSSLRAQMQTDLALGDAYPQLLVRYGHAAAMPRSLRRPLEEVLV
ncbi:MAG: hypothetical protein VB089_03000 [Anaerolineaceae bacterium]|nr:hypothetical protein [Anaerolineaceae bacterium]